MSAEKDVATVLALEEPAKALVEAINAARPAIDRLEKAKYAGAEWVSEQSGMDLDQGTLASLVEALRWLRESAGNEAAWDYRFFVESMNQTVVEGAKTILDQDDDEANLRRVEGLRQYAATVAQ
jgi:hypothetical protein